MYVCNIFILCYTTNIYMLLLSLTYVVQKIPQHAHVLFLWSTVRLDPCHHSDTVSKFTVSQWDHTSSKVGYHDHVWNVSSQREYDSQSTLNPMLYDNLVNRCTWRSSSHTSPLSETRHVSGCSLLKTYHTNSCQTSRVDLCVSFFLYSVSNSGRKPTARLCTQTGHEYRRRCQLLQRETVNR